MTLRGRPRRQQEERSSIFVEQAAAPDVEQLHCQIPAELHLRLRLLAAERKCTMTSVVLEALEDVLCRARIEEVQGYCWTDVQKIISDYSRLTMEVRR